MIEEFEFHPMSINSAEQRLNAAVLALVYLGRCKERSYIAHSEIAREQDMLTKDVMKLMRSLAAAGFVKARSGGQGGVRISKPLSQISISELYEACKRRPHDRATPKTIGLQDHRTTRLEDHE